MAELDVEVDDELFAALQLRAARHGRSVEEEHREILQIMLKDEPDSDSTPA